VRRGEGRFERVARQRFAEPHDVGTPHPAAAVRDRVEIEPVIERPALAAARAARLAQRPVKFEDVVRACPPVQRVDVLRDEREARYAALERRQRDVRRGGFDARVGAPSFVVPVPHHARLAGETRGRSEFLEAPVPPQAPGAAERREPALGRDSGARQNAHGSGGGEPRANVLSGNLHANANLGARANSIRLCPRAVTGPR